MQTTSQNKLPDIPLDPTLVQNFADDTLKTIGWQSHSLLMKIHIGVAFCVTTICFLAWHYTAQLVDPHAFWWWIYPFFLFALTLNAHAFIESKQYMKAVVSSVLILNLMLFITDGLTTTESYTRWFLYPWCISAMILLAAYHFTYHTTTVFQLAVYEYIIIVIILFLIYLQTSFPLEPNAEHPFPWFFIPAFVLAEPLAVIFLRNSLNEFRLWVHLSVGLVIFNLMLMVIWGYQAPTWPWFLLCWGISCGVIFYLWKKYTPSSSSSYSVVDDGIYHIDNSNSPYMPIDPEDNTNIPLEQTDYVETEPYQMGSYQGAPDENSLGQQPGYLFHLPTQQDPASYQGQTAGGSYQNM